ncbi:MAG: DNA recombination protein RmuC [Prolixibacteraceae bacterium]|nr:DNA recombination protein RmuC [Prolixibacteraceae bacterium]
MNTLLLILLAITPVTLVTIFFMVRISSLKNEKTLLISELEKKFSQDILDYEKKLAILEEREKQIKSDLENSINNLSELRKNLDAAREEKTRLFSENKNLTEKIEFQAKEFEKLQKQALSEFENIAAKILKTNTQDFSEVNQKKIAEIILPLKEKIQVFEKKVEETYEKGLKDQTDLRAELKKLYELNSRISNEATNLTKALKGDVKQQGNWGEVVLERILERSGLNEGQEYERERVVHNADGKIIRPDVIVNLPDKKHIVIDSKVSLIAYERFVNSDDLSERDKFMKEHILSLKNHVKELSNKHYSSSPQINSPDFVLLFIPIESSFSIAIEHDHLLFNYAWENKVVIVSPSTLLATLRTIASIWQQENQTKNAIEIARQSGALYDKFVGFLDDLEKIGRNIGQLQRSYDDASKKLNTGTGNIIRRVEHLKELGASSSKKIPDKYIE